MARFSNFTWDDQGVYIKGLQNSGDKYGIALYRFPHCYELVGTEFVIVAADGREFPLKFCDQEWAELNGVKCRYELLKQEDGIYFAQLGPDCAVLDLQTGTAALVFRNRTEVVPGYLKGIGETAPGFAIDDMAGTDVFWYFGVNRFLEQRFLDGSGMVSTWSSDGFPDSADYQDVLKVEPQGNHYIAVKFRDSFYLVSSSSEWVKNACCPRGTDMVVLLEDYERCMACGSVSGKGFDPIVVTGYAKFAD